MKYANLCIVFKTIDYKEREARLNIFFVKITNGEFSLVKLANRAIIERIFRAEKYCYKYKETGKAKDWNDFWEQFLILRSELRKEYWANFHVLYNDTIWYRFIKRIKNPVLSYGLQFLKFSHKLLIVLIILGTVALYLILYDAFLSDKQLKEYYIGVVTFLYWCIVLFILNYLLLSGHHHIRTQEENKISKFLRRNFPRIWEFLNDEERNKKRKVKKKTDRIKNDYFKNKKLGQ
ncbi:hypothetical protein CS953_10175 [Bacillus safensis]|uniref:hypothetical protein n=1 Tax=Bacillus safensis TaxID=561879 RepID=UPI000EF2E469|nr:hypothetical protein [Bacillus safensis]AYJ90062.1 hypothetical protein CS953_10175 [Bacillus safensis]